MSRWSGIRYSYGCGCRATGACMTRTRGGLLTDRQLARLEAVFAADEHVAVEVTWWAHQQIITAYADQDRHRGKTLLTAVIDRLRAGLPAGLDELATLGRTLHRRRHDIRAYFDHHAPNSPTEAINGRLEALRRNALGSRNLINYRIRSLLHCGALALWIRKSRIDAAIDRDHVQQHDHLVRNRVRNAIPSHALGMAIQIARSVGQCDEQQHRAARQIRRQRPSGYRDGGRSGRPAHTGVRHGFAPFEMSRKSRSSRCSARPGTYPGSCRWPAQ